MSGFQICSDGQLLPRFLACPPPYGPFPYYPPAAPIASDTDNGAISLSAGAIVGIVILLGFVFLMACFLVLKFAARSAENRAGGASRSQDPQVTDRGRNHGLARATTNSSGGGLEDGLVKLLPVDRYRQKKLLGSGPRDCAVCLSSFEDDEFVRILPRCQHTFHLPCIDRWFESHANCPLCREHITLQIIQAPEQLPQQSSEIAAVSISDGGEESNEPPGEVQANSAVPEGGNGAEYCELLIQKQGTELCSEEGEKAAILISLKSDASGSTPGGIKSFPGSRCEDCGTKQPPSSLKSARPDQFWGNTPMASTASLRRSYSTGSMKLEVS